MFDASGSAFYVEPPSESITPQESAGEQTAAADRAFAAADAIEVIGTPVNPPYTRYNEAGDDTFAPQPNPMNPDFAPQGGQAQQAPMQQAATGFQFQPWMLLALGAAVVLWLRSEDR